MTGRGTGDDQNANTSKNIFAKFWNWIFFSGEGGMENGRLRRPECPAGPVLVNFRNSGGARWLTSNGGGEPATESCYNSTGACLWEYSHWGGVRLSVFHLSCSVIFEANFWVEIQISAGPGVDYASKICARSPELLRGDGNLIPKAFEQNI